MSNCKNVCKLCRNLVISESVSFTGGNLVITIPAGSYSNNCKVCLVIAQAIPDTTTINAPVVIQIGTGTEQYPLTKCNCAQVTACGVRTRTKYCTVVSTSATGGTFKLLGKASCAPDNSLTAIDGTTPTTTTPTALATEEVAVASGKGAK